MTPRPALSRRSFLTAAGTTVLTAALPPFLRAAAHIPVGLELYSVRDALKKDLMATVSDVAGMGYECVEFYAPYFDWPPGYAKQVRAKLDELNLRCYSTHNSIESFTDKGINKAIELNQALGSRYIVLAHPGDPKSVRDWGNVISTLNMANDAFAGYKMHAGYHNHDLEWAPVEGRIPMEMIAAGTDGKIMLQLDVGTCLAAGSDPVRWVKRNPGRIRSMHCKDWSPAKGYRVLFGEGVAPWKALFAAAETAGGLEYYLIEQEGSDYSELETAKLCLAAFRQLHP
jgi:sugar phosphate isomerase/epimerase